MCKGLGRLERFIHSRLIEQPVCLYCKTLAADAISSRKSMARAMHSFVRKFPRYALRGGRGRHHDLVLYDSSACSLLA